jgi:minor histocompatibility antigen H13
VVYIPYVLHLLTLVTAILYCACHSSLILRKEDPPPGTADSEHGSETSRSTERETLRAEDAYQFPLIGSVSLFSLYLAFKFLDDSLVNFMIAYFAVVIFHAADVGPVSRYTRHTQHNS